MTGIILCVLMNVGIFTCFRLFAKFDLDTFQAITANYVTCVITGILFIDDLTIVNTIWTGEAWVWIGIALGALFIGTFYLMAVTTQKFSMTVSSIASKMSLIIPVLSSLFILGIQIKIYSWLNYLGMVLALIAIVLSSYKKKKIKTDVISRLDLLLPLLVFLLGGIIDSTLNYTNYNYLTDKETSVFPILLFLSAALMGIIVLGIKGRGLSLKSVLGGVTLGIVNYFSIYFLLRALSAFENDGAFVYPLINVGIIMISAVISVVFFKEKLTPLNQAGLALAILAILLISYQEILLI